MSIHDTKVIYYLAIFGFMALIVLIAFFVIYDYKLIRGLIHDLQQAKKHD